MKTRACLKIVFDPITDRVHGMNVFGIRMRHEVWDRWLNEKRTIDHIVEHLADANFDPEFYKQFEKDIVETYNQTFNKNIVARKRSWKRILSRSK